MSWAGRGDGDGGGRRETPGDGIDIHLTVRVRHPQDEAPPGR